MNLSLYIRPSILLGGILGAILGFLTLIPLVNFFTCLTFVLIGAAVIYYMKKNALVGIITIYDGAVIGAISGFVALITASVIYLPCMFLISLFFKTYVTLGFNMSTSFMVAGFNLFVIGMLIFFLAMLSALFNAFTGLVTAYIYELIENNNSKDIPIFTLEE